MSQCGRLEPNAHAGRCGRVHVPGSGRVAPLWLPSVTPGPAWWGIAWCGALLQLTRIRHRGCRPVTTFGPRW